MFRRALKETLVFLLPEGSARLWHTFFCPPVRIVALDKRGQCVYDETVTDWRFVRLPGCRIVLEMNPGVNYRRYLPDILSAAYSGGFE